MAKAKLKNNRQILFSDVQIRMGEKKAGMMGYSFPDYVRFLVVRDNIDDLPSQAFSTEEEIALVESQLEYLRGETEEIEDIERFINDTLDEVQAETNQKVSKTAKKSFKKG